MLEETAENNAPEITELKTRFTDWENEPSVAELKQNLTDAEIDQTKHPLHRGQPP